MRRHASFACLWALVWVRSAVAEPAPCPQGKGAWVQLVFGGTAWTATLREAILRELRIELGRRLLQVCAESSQVGTSVPEVRVTLLADDAQRVSIIPASLETEGSFIGRTVVVGPIPEDARALAIAQAVDEALRSDPARPIEPAPPPKPVPATKPRLPEPPVSNLVLGLALAPVLQIAPAFDGATRASVAPGTVLRLSLRSSSLGGSLGIAVTKASDLAYGSTVIRQFRLPLDLSLRWRLQAGSVDGLVDVGVLAALVDYERSASKVGYRHVEMGGRLGVSVGWARRRVVPWLGASVELLPSPSELTLTPTGRFGHTPRLFLGLALGAEVRWP